MSTLLETPIKISRTVTTSVDQARAIEDPARAKILEILYRKSMSADQITKHLTKSGHKKALTTIRHHLEILKDAGLIQLVKIEETRGAITKYYSTSTRLLGYNVPEDFDTKYSSAIANTSKRIEEIFKHIAPKAGKNKKDSSYSQYILAEIVNRAMTNVMEKKK